MGASTKLMDGSNIKALVADRDAFDRYVEDKFRTLDKAHDGKLSREELQPIVLAIGNALGLPPKGSSPEADHIYDEVLEEFLPGHNESITKEEFTPVLRDILLGVADGLEREPVELSTLSGAELEAYAKGRKFEVDAVGVFTQLPKDSHGKVEGVSALEQALKKVSVQQGMPPAADTGITKNIVEPALMSIGVDRTKNLSQEEFIPAYRDALLAIALQMKEKPVTVAHSEKRFDGSTISTFLKNKPVLEKTLNDTWVALDPFKAGGGDLPKSNLRVGLDLIAPFAGLPPIGAVDEMDHVVDESVKLVDGDKGGMANKEEFCQSMLEVLGGIMLQLEGKPVSVSTSVAANDANPEDCLKL